MQHMFLSTLKPYKYFCLILILRCIMSICKLLPLFLSLSLVTGFWFFKNQYLAAYFDVQMAPNSNNCTNKIKLPLNSYFTRDSQLK